MTAPGTPRPRAAKRLLLAASAAVALLAPLPAGLLDASRASAQSQGQASPALNDVAQRLAEQQAPRNVVPFDPTHFDRYVGYYELSPNAVFKVTRDGGKFLVQLTGQQPVQQYPESETKFFATVVAAQISFGTDAEGNVGELVLHQNGWERHAKRIDEPTANGLAAALAQRIADNKPSPGTEEALRRNIESVENGEPDYDDMAPPLAEAARQQWPRMKPIETALGAMKSIKFVKVGPAGNDIYLVQFEHGSWYWTIAPLGPDGKVSGLSGQPIP
jgi:hypothetical protein